MNAITIALLPGSPGGPEMLIVLALILILFGAKRLPEIARTIGSVLSDLRRASDDFRDQLMRETELDDDDDSIPRTPPPKIPQPDMNQEEPGPEPTETDEPAEPDR